MGLGVLTLAVTYFPAGSSIIGPAVLTAVFGMGTGVSPRVWPPAKAGGSVSGPSGSSFSKGEVQGDPHRVLWHLSMPSHPHIEHLVGESIDSS